jgi:hypothetical protein
VIENIENVKTCGVYSFPKSGNTWVREIIRASIQSHDDISIVCPELHCGVPAKESWKSFNMGKKQNWRFYKSHSAWELSNEMIDGNTDLIIYILRNPFDVFCSQLNYILKRFDDNRKIIELPGNSVEEVFSNGVIDEYFSIFTAFGTLAPRHWETSSWMSSVNLWIKRSTEDQRIAIIKYEDLVNEPISVINKLFNLIPSNNLSAEEIFALVDKRTKDGGNFFWKRTANNYRNYLNKSHLEKFNKFHSEVLVNAGYSHLIYG